jgi:ribosomal protein S7
MIINGHGLLYDPKRHKILARFVDGQIDTNEPRIIELAEMAGFAAEDTSGDDTMHPEYTKDELIEIAEEQGIDVDKRWGVKRIAEAIERANS